MKSNVVNKEIRLLVRCKTDASEVSTFFRFLHTTTYCCVGVRERSFATRDCSTKIRIPTWTWWKHSE